MIIIQLQRTQHMSQACVFFSLILAYISAKPGAENNNAGWIRSLH